MPNTFQDKPLATDQISTSQGDLRQNFGYIQGALGKDHQIVFGDSDTGTAFEGRHTQVSLNNRANNNLPQPGDGTDSFIWSSNGNIFGRNATSAALQLTTFNFSAQAAVLSTGTCFTSLPGGLLIQWGTIINAVSQADTAVTFVGLGGKSFTSLCYGVWTNMQRSGSDNVDTVYAFTFLNTGFTYHNTSGSPRTFNWIAVGA